MIRQAISCDICGTEKRQTNHWFIAVEHGGELRVSGWNARTRLRAGSKHLCGQACLHKLADDFMERIISKRTQTSAPGENAAPITEYSLAAPQVGNNHESSEPQVSTPAAQRAPRPAAMLVPMPDRMTNETPSTAPLETPRYASRSWHAEAWQRERERIMQPGGRTIKPNDQREETHPRRISQG